MNLKHYFIGIDLPADIKSVLNQYTRLIKDSYPFQRWVHPEDYHLTLFFLGTCEDKTKQNLVKQLYLGVNHLSPFQLTLGQAGTFGQVAKPRIFWQSVLNEPALVHNQQLIASICERFGYEVDSRPFAPHITLARKWNAPFDYEPPPKLQKISAWSVTEFCLFQTNIKSVPKYEVVATFPLKKSIEGRKE
ncbi:RNA 2',3'-cyclic phosphodiesterase [Alkalihalobacillus sp. 1P02AB]|uniref:RNA 2',3'-cyclic phosphodiesterase n=1 Tax=Alkalihalobacillus sp. 1P02AB TaxID=3132260 RepID=UPI0039A717DD